MVKTSPFNARGAGSIPGWGAMLPHASRPKNQNIKQKRYYNELNKDLKNGPHQKKKKKTGSGHRSEETRKYFNNMPCGIPDWNPDRSRTVMEELVKFSKDVVEVTESSLCNCLLSITIPWLHKMFTL